MKRTLLFLGIGCIALLLCGCGQTGTGGSAGASGGETVSAEGGDAQKNLIASPYADGDFGEEVALSTEWPIYDPSVSVITFLAENLTGTDLEFGAPYTLEVSRNGNWCQIPMKKDTAWEAIAYVLPAHGTAAHTIHLNGFDTSFSPGDYRIIVKVGEKPYAAEFTLGKSAITADAPYGFTPLEKLPESYDLAQATADGCVVYPNGQPAVNTSAWDTFFTKVRLGISCQVRILRFTTEGDPVLQDVIYTQEQTGGTGRFTNRYDATRDKLGVASGIVDTPYSYLITDAWSIYLSNHVEWRAGLGAEDTAELLSGEEAEPYIEAVQAITDGNLTASVVTYRVWSGDWNAGLTDTAGEFFYETDGGGYLSSLADVGVPKEFTELTGLRWAEAKPNAVLILIGNEVGEGLRWYGVYDPVTKKLLDCAAASGVTLDQDTGTIRLDVPDAPQDK